MCSGHLLQEAILSVLAQIKPEHPSSEQVELSEDFLVGSKKGDDLECTAKIL